MISIHLEKIALPKDAVKLEIKTKLTWALKLEKNFTKLPYQMGGRT